jgi:hydrogenase maturation protease
MRILVAGMGNLLCADDGFGVAVAQALAGRRLPPEVAVIEVGIGGIHLVQELMSGYDALVIADAVDRGAPPGTLFVLEPDVADIGRLAPAERDGLLADMHYVVPSHALMLAKALGVLPAAVRIVGCQGETVDALRLDLSPRVRAGVERAVHRIEAIIAELLRQEAA